MLERESLISPNGDGRPDILKKLFSPDIHPYTMMFLYLVYEEGGYKNLPEQHLKVFDRYYVGDQTIEWQKSEKFRENLTAIIRDGFEILRENASDKLKEVFTGKRLPYFKKSDIPFVDNAEAERKKFAFANRSLSHKGSYHTEKTKKKMSHTRIKKWKEDPKLRKKAITARRKLNNDPNYIEKIRESKIKLWDEYRQRMQSDSETTSPGITRGFTEESRAKLIEASTRLWEDDSYRKRVLETRKKTYDARRKARQKEEK